MYTQRTTSLWKIYYAKLPTALYTQSIPGLISCTRVTVRWGQFAPGRKPFVQLMRPEMYYVQWMTDFIRVCQRWWLNNCVLFGVASYVHTYTILQLHCTQYRCIVHNVSVLYTISVYCTQCQCTVHNIGVLYTISVYRTQYQCTVHNIGVPYTISVYRTQY